MNFIWKNWHLFHHLLKSRSIQSHMFLFRMIFQNSLPCTWDAPFFFFFCFFFFLLKQKKFYYYLCSSFFPAWFPNFSWPFFPNFEVLLYLKSKSPLVVYFVFLAYQNCKCKMTFLFWHIPPEVYHDGSDEACTGKCKCVDHLNHMHQYMQSREIIMNKKIKRNQPFFHMII